VLEHRIRGTRGWPAVLAAAALALIMAVPVTAQDASPAASGGAAAAPSCGTDPVELLAYFETGFPFQKALAAEFTKQFPNVTWNIREDQFSNLIAQTPRLLASDNPPDLIRLPTMVGLVKDGLLLDLEPYVTAFGWDKWPASLLIPHRVAEGGRPRGEGDLYAGGLNYSTTGVFYNKEQAAQIGMTEPPATLADFEALLAKAKEAGLQPIMQWNAAASGGGLAFPLQNLMASLGPVTPINEWIYQKEGATIDTPSNVEAAQHLQQWIQAGYFPEDVNAIEYTDSNARFAGGEGVFTFNGDWQNAQYDKDAPGNIGFFLFPPAEAGGVHGSMSSPVTFGIAAKAKHADCAAFFLNWVATDPTARQINVSIGGSSPGGPSDLPMPEVAAGSVINETLAASQVAAAEGGLMDFIANATGDIFTGPGGWTPELQNLVGGQQTPEGLLKAVQATYEEDLAQ
jgi:raffinose/stachyose/melibiose transport system substrate-binding protein